MPASPGMALETAQERGRIFMGSDPKRQSNDDGPLSGTTKRAKERDTPGVDKTNDPSVSEPSDSTGATVTDDIVDEASEASFTASDSPNWATGQQRRPRNP